MHPLAVAHPPERCAGPADQGECVGSVAAAGHRREFDLLFAATSDGVLLVGAGGTILRANAAAGQLLGFEPCHPAQGAGVRTLFAPCDHRVESLLAELRCTGTAAGTVTALRGDGAPVEVRVRMTQYLGSGGEPRTIVVLRRAGPLPSSARSGDAALQQLPASVTHDLRAPLGTLSGFAKALDRALGPDASPRNRHYVERILAAAGQLEGHMEALLSSARIAHAPLAPRRVDLSDAARRILRGLQLCELDRIVSVQVQDGLCAGGDPSLLTVLLENLLGNAWKFTGRRAEANIAFTGEAAADGSVVYRVRDDGAGFDMEHAGKLFGDFQRLHSQAGFPGTGMGLANARRIVERHGGRIWAESAPGQGASFWFTLGGRPMPVEAAGANPALKDEARA